MAIKSIIKKIVVEDIEPGMKKGPGGDYYEHDLAKLAHILEHRQQQRYSGKRICFDYDISRIKNKNGVRHPVVIVEGRKGYQPTTFDIGSTDETALWNVERANKSLALTKEDIRKIIDSSM